MRLLVLMLLAGIAGFTLSADPVRIMRIGDSITWQMSGDATLETLLEEAGIEAEFVGTQNWFDDGGYVPETIASEPAQNVEGYPGMTLEWFTDPDHFWASFLARPTVIPQGTRPIDHALTRNTPDIILLMIGANNMGRDVNGDSGPDSTTQIDVAGLTSDYNALLDRIEALAPDAHTFVAEVTTSNDTGGGQRTNRAQRTRNFNEQVVRPVVEARIEAGKSFTLLDFFPVLSVPDDFYDDGTPEKDYVHPGISGIVKLNKAWFKALRKHLTSLTYDEWVEGFPELAADDGKEADPDRDHLANLFEFGMGLHPMEHSEFGLVELVESGGLPYLQLRLTRPDNRLGVHLVEEVSSDAMVWLTGLTETTITDNEDGTETVVIRDLLPSIGTDSRYMRVIVAEN